MKHSVKVTAILIAMFFIAQLIGIFVTSVYLPDTIQVKNEATGLLETKTSYTNLPETFRPPSGITPVSATTSIMISLLIAVLLMLFLMKFNAEMFLRIWFFIVVVIGITLALNAFIVNIHSSYLIATVVAIPLAFLKIFKRNLIVHNLTELLIYPGIASVFIPILSIGSVVFLLFVISIYDIYAVWHAGFMQKMAKYQIEKLRIFSGFFVPYIAKKDRLLLKQQKKKKAKAKRVKINLAILGGGDVIFPILLSGVVLRSWGMLPAILIAIGATISLAYLFYKSEKGKFYPAMPFISVGCLIALAIAYFI